MATKKPARKRTNLRSAIRSGRVTSLAARELPELRHVPRYRSLWVLDRRGDWQRVCSFAEYLSMAGSVVSKAKGKRAR